MTESTQTTLYKASRSPHTQNQGGFRVRFNFPGMSLPSGEDHGHGPLATVVESFMDPGTLIQMHQHRNEEIISWVPDGVMRHDDREGNELITDADHLLVMNAGSGFWHEERTRDDDPPLRMLQIFVRPHSLDLEPGIQHERIPEPVPNEWRLLFGPEGGDAPAFVRNDVRFYDARLDAGASVDLPAVPGWDAYVYVFEGSVEVDGRRFEATESALSTAPDEVRITAAEESLLVAFLVNPEAAITRQGTIGR